MAPAAVGLVSQQRLGPGPCPPRTDSWDLQGVQQYRQHRAVVGVAGTTWTTSGRPASIDQRVELGRQAAAGPADRVVDGLSGRTLVVSTVPPVARQAQRDLPRQRGRMLMNSRAGAVDADSPVRLGDRVGLGQQPHQDLVPDPTGRELGVPTPDQVPRICHADNNRGVTPQDLRDTP